jgi:hypothetical protein
MGGTPRVCTCPICGPDFKGEHFVELKEHTYIKTKRWLPEGHPYRSSIMESLFNGKIDTHIKPCLVTIDE